MVAAAECGYEERREGDDCEYDEQSEPAAAALPLGLAGTQNAPCGRGQRHGRHRSEPRVRL